MTLFAFNSNVVSTAIVADMGNGDRVVVGAQGFIGTNNAPATIHFGGGGSVAVTIAGTVAASNGAIVMGDVAGFDGALITVASSGVVDGFYGLDLKGQGLHLANRGTISGDYAVNVQIIGPLVNTIENSGLISGAVHAIVMTGPGTQGLRVINTGTIATRADGDAIFTLDFITQKDTVINRGSIIGNVVLGGGDDLYDGRGGSVQGRVMGGAGADTFIPGSEGEEFSGGDGLDTLNFRFAGAVAVALDGSRQNSGMAAGDSYSGIEVVIGSGRGADDILGATGAERLSGLDGADSLDGQAGNDTLIGGLGADVLTGGLGNDAFRFQRVAESGDSILDFHKVTGDKDQIQIQALGFGGGLTTGLLAVGAFQARADNVAQDGTDRFIFRTTDTTLWYDADGTGAAAAVMLADLQAGVSLVASDILIF